MARLARTGRLPPASQFAQQWDTIRNGAAYNPVELRSVFRGLCNHGDLQRSDEAFMCLCNAGYLEPWALTAMLQCCRDNGSVPKAFEVLRAVQAQGFPLLEEHYPALMAVLLKGGADGREVCCCTFFPVLPCGGAPPMAGRMGNIWCAVHALELFGQPGATRQK